MKVMVIDTALGACVAGVFTGEADAAPPYALGVRAEVMAKGHQERLGGLARDAAAEAGASAGLTASG